MEEAFAIVMFVVVGIGVIGGVIGLAGTGKAYKQIGRGGFSMDRDDYRPEPRSGSAVALRERDEEIRQMLDARNARRVARGEEPVDVETELQRLTAPAIDPQLVEEVRQHVITRNERRARRGEEPLDVEAEVERQLRDLGGG